MVSWPFILLSSLPIRKPKNSARGRVMAAAVRMPAKPVISQLIVSSRPICAAIAPMVMAKLMPMPAMIGMISASTMKALRFRRSSSWLHT